MELFGTSGIRGPVADRVTPDLALAVGQAAAADGDTFVVGRDGRTTGPTLVRAVSAGLASGGARVLRAGVVPTPALAFASRGRRGVVVTASHNPSGDNGLKLFVDGQQYDAATETAIEERIDADANAADWDRWGDVDRIDPLPEYRTAVADFAREYVGGDDDATLSVAVDCGNGTAGAATPYVLRELGIEVTALEANVDGHFPARESKPTPENLTGLRRFVADTWTDVGIAHDGDADRLVLVDADGEVVHEDTVTAILAEYAVEQAAASTPVVLTTPNTSTRIDERVEAAGGRVERYPLGSLHEGVAAEDDVVFAAEPWKHLHPGLGRWIDGVASAAVLSRLIAVDGLATLRDRVTERPFRKVDVDCPDERKAAALSTLETSLPDAFPEADVSTEYGVRLTFDDGAWVLTRPSGTEPYMRVYGESDDVDALIDEVTEVVERAVSNG